MIYSTRNGCKTSLNYSQNCKSTVPCYDPEEVFTEADLGAVRCYGGKYFQLQVVPVDTGHPYPACESWSDGDDFNAIIGKVIDFKSTCRPDVCTTKHAIAPSYDQDEVFTEDDIGEVRCFGNKYYQLQVAPTTGEPHPTCEFWSDGDTFVNILSKVIDNESSCRGGTCQTSRHTMCYPRQLDTTNKLWQLFRYASQDGNVASGTTKSVTDTKVLSAGANPEGYTHARIRIFVSDQLDNGDGRIENGLVRTFIDGVRVNTASLDVQANGDDYTSDSLSATSDTYLFPIDEEGHFEFTYEQRVDGGTGTGSITHWSQLLRVYPVEMLFMKEIV